MKKSKGNWTLEDIKKKEENLLKELSEVKVLEHILIKKVDKSINKEEAKSRKAYFEVMHFSFNDFAQAIIGACVFSFAPFLDTDPWNYIPLINTMFLFSIHIFFMLCIIIALNYEFRDKFNLNWWFIKLLLKRFFYIYFSVAMVMCLVLVLIARLDYLITAETAFRNFLAIQTVGLFGAVTFSFLKK